MATETPFFSIIIPTYNSAKTLAECLESIFNQTFQQVEVIVVDGLSNDATIEIVKSYCIQNDNASFISAADEGTYDAMNKGIKMSKGKWLFFLGSDDALFNADSLEKMYATIKSSKKKVVYGNVLVQGESPWAKNGDIYDGEFDLPKLLKRNICHQAIFYNSSFIKKYNILFNIKYKVLADWDFNLKCWSQTDFLYTNQIIAKFSAGGSSTSSEIKDPFVEEFIPNFLKYNDIDPHNPLAKDIPQELVYLLLAQRKQPPFLNKIKRWLKSKL